MSTWTDSARETLENYLDGSRRKATAAGADGDEVVSDLRRHVEEEAAAQKLPFVTEEDVRRILARTGPLPDETMPSISNRSMVKRVLAPVSSVTLLLFGILLPTATLVIELATHICAGSFFDPLPTWFHVILVATVPLANGISWGRLRGTRSVPRWLWWLNGVALAVGVFYALLYLPMTPFAVIGILFLGFGLLPLTPLISLICTFRLAAHLRRRAAERNESRPRGRWWVAAATGAFLTVFALHGPLTQHWIDSAASESTEEATHAIRMLRIWGSEDVLLKECYGRSERFDPQIFNNREANSAAAQKIFYRVTGKSFNAVPPPLSKYQRSAQGLFNDFEWDGDSALGGEVVAGQVKGLSLQQSRIDGTCEPDEGWAYLQWTFEFRNEHEWSQREARAQVLLPPGAVVSRVTLWVNGEPREAAFAGRGETRAAYQQVAVQQRRDPVLVTTSGPDRVLMQCFPIQPKGGTMKVRLGITVPLLLESTNEAALRLPCLVERNFRIPSKFEHNFWLDTTNAVRAKFAKLVIDSAKGRSGVRGQISETSLANNDAMLRFTLTPNPRPLLAADPKSNRRVISQTIIPVNSTPPRRVAIVLDGSENMTSVFPEIGRALEGFPSTELSIWLAQDGVSQLFNSSWARSETSQTVIARLKGVGGQDDLPALVQAWEWAAAHPESFVLWFHDAQPVLLSSIEALKQRLDWRSGEGTPRIIDVPVRPVPNRIAEQFATSISFEALPRTGSLREDLERLFSNWSGRKARFTFARVEKELDAGETPKASAHIVRLWAAERIRELAKSRRVSDAVKLAGEQQLVTIVSGAVVLETKQQYAAAGLSPADPSTVPTVPEPSAGALIILGAIVLALSGLKRRQARR